MNRNPFKSERQRRYLWKFHPDIARRWAEEEKLKSNPQSAGFEWLDNGAFSEIYKNGWRVEAVISPSRRGEIDVSKDIMISARDRASPAAKSFIPNIERKRIDRSSDGTIEFIYEMPYYEKYTNDEIDWDKQITDKGISLEEQVPALERNFSDQDIKGMVEALQLFREETEKLGLKFVNDMKERNIVMLGDQIILLDCFYAISDDYELLERRWRSKGRNIIHSLKQRLKHLTHRC